MVDKLHEYEGWTGRAHAWRDSTREHLRAVKSSWTPLRGLRDRLWGRPHPPGVSAEVDEEGQRKNNDFVHIYRRKTRKELVRISAAVMGIEFSYAGETAFVSPTLLKIGVAHQHMTLVWALSPLVGFFLTPILGSLSDRCRSVYGRRRPFIVLLSVGVLLGLLLVPNGEDIGYSMGDFYPYGDDNASQLPLLVLPHRTSANKYDTMDASNLTSEIDPDLPNSITPHPWGVFFTILGTVLLDFDADACQSPSRAYLLDVTVPEDHARGLSTFTIMAGLGGFFGYGLGGINWDATAIGVLFGGHVRAVFSLITIIFIVCVSYTISSFSEIPLDILEDDLRIKEIVQLSNDHTEKALISNRDEEKSYGTANNVEETAPAISTNPFRNPEFLKEEEETTKESNDTDESMNTILEESNLSPNIKPETEFEHVSLKHYLMSILIMPFSLRIVCVTNLFSWMAHVCYSLYFTDFVGEAVFLGNPAASEGTLSRDLYEEGVRFGCWGMSMYSLSCACYSLIIEKLIKRYGAKKVYVGGLLTNSLGMMLMALTKHRAGVIIFSWTAGVMYSTLFTMPYLLVAHYHARGTFEVSAEGEGRHGSQLRGLGTDVAIVSSMVFLAQFILSMCMGSIVSYSGTTTAVVSVASCLAFFSAVSATQIMYLDL